MTEKNQEAERPELYGVGGWLGFLVLMLMLISPLINLGFTNANLQMFDSQFPELIESIPFSQIRTISYSAMALSIIGSISAGAFLLSYYKPFSVWYTIFVLIALGPVAGIITELLILETASNVILLQDDAWAGVASPTQALGPMIWTIYFIVSQRVKNTYFSD